jgi:hypothetical protein
MELENYFVFMDLQLTKGSLGIMLKKRRKGVLGYNV